MGDVNLCILPPSLICESEIEGNNCSQDTMVLL